MHPLETLSEALVEDVVITNTLIEVGIQIGARSLEAGVQSETLQEMAQSHAEYMAVKGRGGHQGWGERFAELNKSLPEYHGFREIAAESFPGSDEVDGAHDCWDGWEESRGHWKIANGSCAIWGYAMAYSERTKRWYACGIMGNEK